MKLFRLERETCDEGELYEFMIYAETEERAKIMAYEYALEEDEENAEEWVSSACTVQEYELGDNPSIIYGSFWWRT